ncbi:MAG TPA: DPP IV N-terminal domain-containing protein [Candidatus Baltobacteraceae bacterium]
MLLALLCPATAPAADLTTDEVFAVNPPWGAQPSAVTWAPDARSFLYVLRTQQSREPVPVWQYDVARRQARILIDPRAYGRGAETPANLVWSPGSAFLAFTERNVLYVRDMATNMDRVVAKDASAPQWSPDNRRIAYVHDEDLYVATLLPHLRVQRLTGGGIDNTILNGDLDWVYPEELGTAHGYAWSPDGRSIAYMRMDERPVTAFPIVDFLKPDNTVTYQRYPLAGERNPAVTLHLVDLASGRDTLLYDAAAHDEYLPHFAWRPASNELLAEILDRAQLHLRVIAWEGRATKPRTLLEQTGNKWIDAVPLPQWTASGESLWVLDRGTTAGLFARSAGGALQRLTPATFRVFSLLGYDAHARIAFVSAAYPTRRDRSVLAVPLSGSPFVNLTPAAGAHSVSIAPDASAMLDTYSTLDDPPQTDLLSSSGRVLATVVARSGALAQQLLPTQMIGVDSQYGKLDALMLRPPGFDPARKYPVVIYVYGGPEAPTTADEFGNMRGLYHQLLAREGFIVFSLDGPASQVDSSANVRLLYHNFGPGSLLGQRIAVQYLRSLPYVDPSRIGIWGWSFGGYETTYALTHTDLFHAGVAGAPVTDWHLYDTIYTERYMGRPQDDAHAYDASSSALAAGKLHGRLLIVHGTSDDNVHMANTITFLQNAIAGDQTHVNFMAYPRQRHGFTDLADWRALYERMLRWWSANL